MIAEKISVSTTDDTQVPTIKTRQKWREYPPTFASWRIHFTHTKYGTGTARHDIARAKVATGSRNPQGGCVQNTDSLLASETAQIVTINPARKSGASVGTITY